MAANLDPQLALDERAVNAPDLEAALNRHLRAKDDVAEARGVMKTYRKEVDAELAKVGDFPPDSALRVGRFRITKRLVPGGHREFDTSEREQLSFSLVDEDGNATRRSSGSRAKPASVSDDEDLRPAGPVNVDALKGEAERASEPTPIKRPRNGSTQPPATH